MPSVCHKDIKKVWSIVTIGIVILCASIQCHTNINKEVPATIQVNTSWLEAIGQGPAQIPKLMALDSSLYQIVNTAILGQTRPVNNDSAMINYLTDSGRVWTRDTASRVFKGFDWQQTLGLPMARYHRSFPDHDIPTLYTLITDFNYSMFHFQSDNGHDAIGIGVEMFLGKAELYDQLSIANPNFSNYLNRTFNVVHLPSKIMYALANEVVSNPGSNRLLDNLLSQGKQIYLVHKWMPDMADSILLEYTADQLKWVEDNELDIWRFLLADRLLYKVSGQEVANLVFPSPHSQGMPVDAPGRAANYIGWKIIQAYMQKSGATDAAMALDQNYDQILKVARYRPD